MNPKAQTGPPPPPDAPIRTLSAYFRERYGQRVHKVVIDGGFTCPNRDGTKGSDGCAFCDGVGSRAPYCPADANIREQIRLGIERMSRRFRANLFIAYFQPFSGTYAPPESLRERYDAALGRCREGEVPQAGWLRILDTGLGSHELDDDEEG